LERGVGEAASGLSALAMTGDWPDFVSLVDDPTITVAQLVADVRRRARKGLRLVFIDYLQLLCKQEYESVTETSRILKKLARETGVPIISLSQLRRPTDGAPKRPTMHHLKQSGALEADADLITLLSDIPEESIETVKTTMRAKGWTVDDPAYYGKRFCRFDLAKNRHGETFSLPAYFSGAEMTWQAVNRTLDGRKV
jgi:replicative DNA helicase